MNDESQVVANTFQIANKVDEYGVVFGTALALAKSFNMLGNEVATHGVDNVFQPVRLHDKPVFFVQSNTFNKLILLF